ncbi:MAG TPA: tetratricopeptide repeat protein [Gammaproteobacteria bacterium]|nr:tetratricopeptide repeat protein [Gammaproteobacteria bacterium]
MLSIFGTFRVADESGNEIPIKSRKSKALLAYLALPPGKPRSRERIMALLWSDRGDQQARASLRQALSGLRKDLGDEGLSAVKITNESLTLDPAHVIVEPASPGDVLLDGLHLADPVFEEWLRDERLRHEDAAAPIMQPPGRPLPDRPSIAVLPFVNLSCDSDQDYFADGLTDDIIGQLARFRSLFVISSTSSFPYKGKSSKAQEVGRELGVAYVAQGNVRKVGNRVRITVELVAAATGQQIWGERYDGELEDVFSLQDEIASKVVSTLAGHIEDADRLRAAGKPASDLAAYELVLLGEQLERKFTKDGVLAARSLFQQAIARDPGNARAHASVARTFLDEFWADWSTDRDGATEQAFDWAQKAVALDALDNRARTNLGVAYHLCKGNFEAAQAQFARALELNPNDADAYCLQGWCHVYAGEEDDAIACTDRAMRLSPLETYDCYLAQFFAHYAARRYTEALASLGRIVDPAYPIDAYRAACFAQLGRDAEARNAMDAYMATAQKEIAIWPGKAPKAWQRHWAQSQPFRDSADLEHLLDGFRKAGMPV